MSGRLLDRLPEVGNRRIAVRLTPDALRQVRGGHPWVFDRAVTSTSHDGAPGDLAVVFDDRRRFAAIGLWDPTSPIRVRILAAGEPVTVDAELFTRRLVDALAHRQVLVDDPGTTAYRWVNGESDGFGGLVLDRYDATLVCKLYSPAWLPHLRGIVDGARDLVDAERVVLRLARTLSDSPEALAAGVVDGQVLIGDVPDGPVEFLERGRRFGADVVHGQKTGHFLDQRDNRVLVGDLAAGADVLDVFCCTGGFSVHAAAGGAASVRSVDLSGPALATTRDNMARNRDLDAVAACEHRTEEGDAFDVLEAHAVAGRTWDVVVIDPPSFAPRREAIDRARRAYARLTHLGMRVTRPGGTLVQSSCSSRIDADTFFDGILDVASSRGVALAEIERTGHAVDHPATFPEARYLKTLVARVGSRS